MKKRYFIKLKPLSSFYFGSTKDFGKNNQEYFLKSNLYPQQTAVLGMVRKKILEDNDCLVEQKSRTEEHILKEKEYIGEISENLSESNFGKIIGISPIQLYKDSKELILFNKTDGFETESSETNKGNKRLVAYNPKETRTKLLDINNKKFIEIDQIFISSVEIGINRGKENDGFFKKLRYKFDKDYYYGFYLWLEEGAKLKNGIVQLGDKYSLFRFELSDKPLEESNDIKEYKEECILFLGDTFLNKEDLDRMLEISDGSLIDNQKFKFIVRKKKRYQRQERSKNLISRGSILLCDTNGEIKNILNNKKYENIKRIGLNHFKIIGSDE